MFGPLVLLAFACDDDDTKPATVPVDGGSDAAPEAAAPLDASADVDAEGPVDSGVDAAMCTDAGGVTVDIAGNHGHVLMVTPADLSEGEAKGYSIQGTSSHDHAVSITAAELADIAAGKTVLVTSTSADSHSHDITLVCN